MQSGKYICTTAEANINSLPYLYSKIYTHSVPGKMDGCPGLLCKYQPVSSDIAPNFLSITSCTFFKIL